RHLRRRTGRAPGHHAPTCPDPELLPVAVRGARRHGGRLDVGGGNGAVRPGAGERRDIDAARGRELARLRRRKRPPCGVAWRGVATASVVAWRGGATWRCHANPVRGGGRPPRR